jgi:hypothetical protein
MKRIFLLIALGALLSPGCATKVNDNQRAITPPAEELPQEAQIGMTREDIDRIYGHPKAVIMTQGGEMWHYDNTGMLWIPFNFGYRYRQSNFTFDRTGHLKNFRIDK